MLTTIRPSIWQSVKYIAISNDVHDMMPHLLVLSKFRNLATFSVILPRPIQSREANYKLVDIPWHGCTHIRLEKSGRDSTEAAISTDSAPCLDCQRIIRQIHKLEDDEVFDTDWELAQILYHTSDFWLASARAKA